MWVKAQENEHSRKSEHGESGTRATQEERARRKARMSNCVGPSWGEALCARCGTTPALGLCARARSLAVRSGAELTRRPKRMHIGCTQGEGNL